MAKNDDNYEVFVDDNNAGYEYNNIMFISRKIWEFTSENNINLDTAIRLIENKKADC